MISGVSIRMSLTAPTVTPVPAYTTQAVQVSAYRDGRYAGIPRPTGSLFNIQTPVEYSPYWMAFTGTYPADWAPYLEPYMAPTDRHIYRPVTAADAEDWAANGVR